MARFFAVLRFVCLLIIGDRLAWTAYRWNRRSKGKAARAIREIRARRADHV